MASAFGTLPLEWARAFEAAGRLGSFSAAAEECGLTQAAISQRIANLEARLGTSLFFRQARGVNLTAQGEAWLPYVSAALNNLQQSAEDMFGAPNQRVTMLASGSVTQLWLAPRLHRLQTRMTLSFVAMATAADYERRDANVDVRYGMGQWEGRRAAPLYAEELTPMCAPALLTQGRDWQDLPRIAVSGPRWGWQEWISATDTAATPVPYLRFDTFSSALAAALSGAGVLMASLALCEQALQSGDLQRTSAQTLTPTETYWLTSLIGAVPARQWDDLVQAFCA